MLARSAGIPVKAFAAGYQKHPFTYFSLDDNPITTPQDMIGKTIATQPTAFILLRALLAKNGIAEDQVTLVNMGSDMNQLMTGQADAVTGWQTNTNALKMLGDKRVDMMLWDTGIQLYANVYYTTDDTLAEHADVLADFLRGRGPRLGLCQGASGRGGRHAGRSLSRSSTRRPRWRPSPLVHRLLLRRHDQGQGLGPDDRRRTGRRRSTSTPSSTSSRATAPTVDDVMTLDDPRT